MRFVPRTTPVISARGGSTSMRAVLGVGPKGADGANVLPTDTAVENALAARGLPVSGDGLSASTADSIEPGETDPQAAVDARAATAASTAAAAAVAPVEAKVSDREVMTGGSPGASAINIVQGNAANAIAADLGGALIIGGGTDTQNNIAGGDGSATVGTSTPNATSTGTGAHFSVVGGYDCVAGGLASMVLGFHCYTGLGTTHCTISGGSAHKATGTADYATIGGGTGNEVSGDSSTIAGGTTGLASGLASTVSGGSTNQALGSFSVVAGGATNSAKNSHAVVTGGNTNTAQGDSSVIGGGTQNTVGHATNTTWGTYSRIGGGFQNNVGTTAQAQYATLGGGRGNSIQTDYGTIAGGRENQVKTRNYGSASGYGAVADKFAQHSQASGYFSAAGDAQTSVLISRRQTTDATQTELLLDGANFRLDMPLNTTWAFSILVAARRADADGENGAYKIEGCIRRDAVSVTMVGTPTVTTIAEDAAAAAWDVTVAAASGRLEIKVTGEAAKTINWVARTTLVEVGG